MDESEKKVIENIKEYGCHVMHVAEGEGPNEPRFAYSIGIMKRLKKPELIVTGLKQDLAHFIVNEYNQRLGSGEEFVPGEYYSDFIGNFDVCFIEVANKHYDEHFGWAKWYYKGNSFKVLQLIWPTTDGTWPWDDDASEFYRYSLPILNETGRLNEI